MLKKDQQHGKDFAEMTVVFSPMRKTDYPLRNIVETRTVYGTYKDVLLDCNHVVFVRSNILYKARCNKCPLLQPQASILTDETHRICKVCEEDLPIEMFEISITQRVPSRTGSLKSYRRHTCKKCRSKIEAARIKERKTEWLSIDDKEDDEDWYEEENDV